jgi:hypothetical protein
VCNVIVLRVKSRAVCGGQHCIGHASVAMSSASRPWWQRELIPRCAHHSPVICKGAGILQTASCRSSWCVLEPQVQGKSWSQLVQGQRCGQLLQSNTPSEHSPSDLCSNSFVRCASGSDSRSEPDVLRWQRHRRPSFQRLVITPHLCRLALTRPHWSPGVNSEFPASFQEVVRLLVLAAGKSTATEHADQREAWPLTVDVTRSILAMAAYPISSWLPLEQALAASG